MGYNKDDAAAVMKLLKARKESDRIVPTWCFLVLLGALILALLFVGSIK